MPVPKTVKAFCKKYHACQEGREWAEQQNVKYMSELWELDMRDDWRIWIATQVLTNSELRLFSCWCVRQVWHLLTDERSREAVRVAERRARGKATDGELAAASAAARDAAWAARAAAYDARAAASAAARAAAYDARAAAYDAWATAYDANAAAQAKQSKKLKTLVKWR